MARRKKKNRQSSNRSVKRTTNQAAPAAANESQISAPEEDLEKIEAAAIAEATDEDLQAVVKPLAVEEGVSVVEMIKRATEALALLETQRARAEASEADAKAKIEALEADRQSLKDGREMLEQQINECDDRVSSLDEREQKTVDGEAELIEKQEKLAQREIDADSGFAQRNLDALAQLEKDSEDLRERFSNHRAKIAEERTAWEEELLKRRNDLDAEIEFRRTKVGAELESLRSEIEVEAHTGAEAAVAERQVLKADHKRIRKEAQNLETDQEILVEDRAAFGEKVAQRAAREIEIKDGEIRALEERLAAARDGRAELARQIGEREDADRKFGNQTPAEVMQQIRTLQAERDKLRTALGGRPTAEAAQRLEDLERQRELWDSDRLKLMAELADAKQNAARKRIAVTELESLRDMTKSLEAGNSLLHEANRQLRAEVDGLVKGAEGKSSFPSCSHMDSSSELQASRHTTDEIRNLKDFAHFIRHRMAYDPKTEKALYYSPEDVRSFLGGLAMTRLHLLQGISGTGKTSLPLAFAKAIGAGSALIEVQAGWRDRQDLIGHFNTFERRFYESEFLQALYKASCPQYRDTPFIVILDEMNLSHPEQYFADLLSALEQDAQRQQLVLMTAAVDPAPQLLKEGGTKLPLPQNVWFVGTANHDETTKDFADKTYDRAHVMELPRHKQSFSPEEFQPQFPVSMQALIRAFDDVKNKHEKEAGQAYGFLEERLGEMLGGKFGVGWGNRLERQMSDYVPVVIGAGGSVGEATDNILATKLLRKIRDRHDNRPEDIIALRELIGTEWRHLDPDNDPKRSVDLLNLELRRLGHDDD